MKLSTVDPVVYMTCNTTQNTSTSNFDQPTILSRMNCLVDEQDTTVRINQPSKCFLLLTLNN